MSLAGTAAITELWGKIKAYFGHSVEASTTATTASITLKNGEATPSALGNAATIPAATTSAAGVMTADDKTKLNGIATGANNYSHPTTTAVAAAAKKVGNDAQGHVVLGDALTASDVGAAASSHAHGNITSGGDITATAPTIASGDKLIINDESASKVTNGPSFGTDTTKYLRNDGSWAVPANSGEANQNAFSNVKVGSTTIAADTKTDTLELVAGSNVTLTPDATNDKVTIAATDTTYSDFTGAASSSVGARGLVPAPPSGGNKKLLYGDGFWRDLEYILNDISEGDSGYLFIEPDGSGSGVLSFIDISTTYAKKASPALTGTPTAPTATAGTNTTQIATTAFVTSAISAAQTGAALFQGTVAANTTISNSSYKKGWYWVVSTAGTYVGQSCEVGDMVFAIANKGSSYSASDFSVVQNNIVEMTAAEVDAICV